jgi:hypothetical protein
MKFYDYKNSMNNQNKNSGNDNLADPLTSNLFNIQNNNIKNQCREELKEHFAENEIFELDQNSKENTFSNGISKDSIDTSSLENFLDKDFLHLINSPSTVYHIFILRKILVELILVVI